MKPVIDQPPFSRNVHVLTPIFSFEARRLNTTSCIEGQGIREVFVRSLSQNVFTKCNFAVHTAVFLGFAGTPGRKAEDVSQPRRDQHS